MLKSIINLFNLLTRKQRGQFYSLQILIILMAFLEIVGVASIIPFMTLVGDMAQMQNNLIIAQVYEASGISSTGGVRLSKSESLVSGSVVGGSPGSSDGAVLSNGVQ